MKASELMLGDWVSVDGFQVDDDGKNPVYQLLTRQVQGLRKGVVTIDCYEFYPGLCMPIPLTPEILEKNGFVLREGCTSAWDWHSNDYSVHVSGNNEQVPMQITIYVPSRWSPHGSSRLLDDLSVRYIHKLQHALRLAGIKKEIVL